MFACRLPHLFRILCAVAHFNHSDSGLSSRCWCRRPWKSRRRWSITRDTWPGAWRPWSEEARRRNPCPIIKYTLTRNSLIYPKQTQSRLGKISFPTTENANLGEVSARTWEKGLWPLSTLSYVTCNHIQIGLNVSCWLRAGAVNQWRIRRRAQVLPKFVGAIIRLINANTIQGRQRVNRYVTKVFRHGLGTPGCLEVFLKPYWVKIERPLNRVNWLNLERWDS